MKDEIKNEPEILFPYDNVREQQTDLIEDIKKNIQGKKSIIVHAPTGLGKTAASLAPALSYALKNNLSIFFLTSRHTQHQIVIETLSEIKKKFGLNFSVADIIGKKWMCIQQNVNNMISSDFINYCKTLREKGQCEFYTNARNENGKLTAKGKQTAEELEELHECNSEKVIEVCKKSRICPYEITTALANPATVIISDYFYLFNPRIREKFLRKINKDISKSIVIIDEGHNLPKRVRDLMSERITTFQLVRAIKEAKKFNFEEVIRYIIHLTDVLNNFSKEMKSENEKLVDKESFVREIEKIGNYDEIIAEIEYAGDEIRQIQKQSYLSSIADFLEKWKGPDDGFARILSLSKSKKYEMPLTMLSYRCLDPSVVSKELVNNASSVILMSGTLNPTTMYRDVLGFDKITDCREYKNPFPKKNRMNIIIPETTTKFTMRNEAQFEKIAGICADITNSVNGNIAIFFPSYSLRNSVSNYFNSKCRKTTFQEESGLTKKEKEEMLENFKKYRETGAVLLAVSSGSFGEGINLPDLLKCVIIVGLPLGRPDLETQKLIEYYDRKFQKGIDYGYIFPAMNKCLQSAGRCIRSETDRGVMIFLDERFVWKKYSDCFPKDMGVVVARDYISKIHEFFS